MSHALAEKRAEDGVLANPSPGVAKPPRRIEDLTGQRFNRWHILGYSHAERSSQPGWQHFWKVKCDCGIVQIRTIGHIRSGKSTSCGCKHAEILANRNQTHGLSRTSPEYSTWKGMHARCSNPNHQAYSNYGGRGITVCSRWSGREGFENFLTDMGPRPGAGSKWTIERHDNELGYFPGNCSWETRKSQNRNKRNSRILHFRGKSQCLSDWAKEVGISQSCLYHRVIVSGWPIDVAMTTAQGKKPSN